MNNKNFLFALAAAVLLSACGGGGSSGGAVTLLAPQASLSLDSPSVSATTGVSNATAAPVIIHATIANAPTATLPFKVTFSGTAIAGADLAWTSPSSATLTVTLPNPASLGKGSYSGSVHLMVCNDAGCTQSIKGSPVDIPVSFVVAEDATFTFQQPSWHFRATTVDTFPQTVGFSLYLQHIPSTGLFIRTRQDAGGFLASSSHRTVDDSSGGVMLYIDLSVASPASVGSGFFKQNLPIEICYDTDCTRQLVGSPVIQPLTYQVFLTPDHEYSLTLVDLRGITDLAYDVASQKLYVTALKDFPNNITGAVSQIDPVTGSVGTQHVWGENLSHVAVSDDGHSLYASDANAAIIHRLLLPSLTPDLDISLGSFGDPATGGGANIVGDMAVAPGSAHLLAASLTHDPSDVQSAGTVVFDGAVARGQAFASVGFYQAADSVAWGDSSTTLFVHRYSQQQPLLSEIDALNVSGVGLAVSRSDAVDPSTDPVTRIAYAAGHIFDLDGHVRDATTGAVIGRFDIPSEEQVIAMVPDPAHGRIFYTVHQ